MKPYLRHLLTEVENPLLGRHLVREYLQARILESLQRAGAMIPLAFHGGTALRFLYEIARYSEDLDFALERQPELYDFRRYLQTIERDLSAEGYELTLKLNQQKVVNSAFVRFPGLLYELGLSPHASEILAIKLEVDTQPPSGAVLATTIIKRHVKLHLQHHDPASLLAGKLHALLQRTYAKGRDLYDLAWYLHQPNWPNPNLEMLNQALVQSGWPGLTITSVNWCGFIQNRLLEINWEPATADVTPFIMDDSLNMVDRALMGQLLQGRCAG